ncbi:MAG: hypothetical protein R3223_03945 [Longimicrobiales bacterium]|nr:hypothetical protein [Longimicrobiales bacterium]
MENGVIWVGIVAPTVALIVSVYLVWRAIRDERRFVRRERQRRLESRRPDWLPDAWSPGSEEWLPEADEWSPDVEEWSPEAEEWRRDPDE